MKTHPRIPTKKLTRSEAIHLKAALRAIRQQVSDLRTEWDYHRIQQRKVEKALGRLLEEEGLQPHFDPEGGHFAIDYRGKVHLHFDLKLELWGYAEADV